jgi:rhomboid family GlyGly-CTERM serine protease
MWGNNRWPQPIGAWCAASIVFGACSLASWWLVHLGLSRTNLDWQPTLWLSQPWRLYTAAWVHYSPMHLGGNFLALALVAWLGVAARMRWPATLAWLLSMPLCHLALLALPEVLHYGGLSGISHAGVAVVVTWLLIHGLPVQRRIAALLGLGLIAKIWTESPWGEGLRVVAGWDIAVVPWAHASGVVAGVICAFLTTAALRVCAQRQKTETQHC